MLQIRVNSGCIIICLALFVATANSSFRPIWKHGVHPYARRLRDNAIGSEGGRDDIKRDVEFYGGKKKVSRMERLCRCYDLRRRPHPSCGPICEQYMLRKPTPDKVVRKSSSLPTILPSGPPTSAGGTPPKASPKGKAPAAPPPPAASKRPAATLPSTPPEPPLHNPLPPAQPPPIPDPDAEILPAETPLPKDLLSPPEPAPAPPPPPPPPRPERETPLDDAFDPRGLPLPPAPVLLPTQQPRPPPPSTPYPPSEGTRRQHPGFLVKNIHVHVPRREGGDWQPTERRRQTERPREHHRRGGIRLPGQWWHSRRFATPVLATDAPPKKAQGGSKINFHVHPQKRGKIPPVQPKQPKVIVEIHEETGKKGLKKVSRSQRVTPPRTTKAPKSVATKKSKKKSKKKPKSRGTTTTGELLLMLEEEEGEGSSATRKASKLLPRPEGEEEAEPETLPATEAAGGGEGPAGEGALSFDEAFEQEPLVGVPATESAPEGKAGDDGAAKSAQVRDRNGEEPRRNRVVSGFIGASEELVDRPMPVRVNMAAETQERQRNKWKGRKGESWQDYFDRWMGEK